MAAKQVLVGLIVFSIVTVLMFLILNRLLNITEAVSLVIAFAIGLGSEMFYRKKARST